MVQMHSLRASKQIKPAYDIPPAHPSPNPTASGGIIYHGGSKYTADIDQPEDQPFIVAKMVDGHPEVHASKNILDVIPMPLLERLTDLVMHARTNPPENGVLNVLSSETSHSKAGLKDGAPNATKTSVSHPRMTVIKRTLPDKSKSVLRSMTRNQSPRDTRACNDDEIRTTEFSSLKSFLVREEEKVVEFLRHTIDKLQQMAGKKIAKAWIKGICPHKQAKFPYHNKAREEKLRLPPQLPGFWTTPEKCSYIEPDHVKKRERTELLIHLLTLRPSPQQLKTWNEEGDSKAAKDDDYEMNQTHVTAGWTAMLKELAPASVLNDLPNETNEKADERKANLASMYEVAGLLEDYLCHGANGDVRIQWNAGEKRMRGRKRSHGQETSSTSKAKRQMHTRPSSPSRPSRDGFLAMDITSPQRRKTTEHQPKPLPAEELTEQHPSQPPSSQSHSFPSFPPISTASHLVDQKSEPGHFAGLPVNQYASVYDMAGPYYGETSAIPDTAKASDSSQIHSVYAPVDFCPEPRQPAFIWRDNNGFPGFSHYNEMESMQTPQGHNNYPGWRSNPPSMESGSAGGSMYSYPSTNVNSPNLSFSGGSDTQDLTHCQLPHEYGATYALPGDPENTACLDASGMGYRDLPGPFSVHGLPLEHSGLRYQ